MRAPPLHIGVVEVVVEAVIIMEKAMLSVLRIKSTGRTRNATIATIKGIPKRIVLRSRVTTMIVLWKVLLAASRNSRRILNI
jgi:hypothetical protein